ncbi:MAG: hypothetical protein EOM40_18220 [Clostridia bacterium]|nr:hypothetical protein [Clostridia bacterium]NCC45293.1 hypothetical protein [Clostridia bacterium]
MVVGAAGCGVSRDDSSADTAAEPAATEEAAATEEPTEEAAAETTEEPAADDTEAADGDLIPVTFQSKWIPQTQFMGYYVALEKGFYEEEGLDVTILPC